MTARTRTVLLLLAALALVGLPLAGYLARRGNAPGCALDGARIDPLYRVEVVEETGGRHEFCCIRCAELWLGRHRGGVRSVLVTDEESGAAIPAGSAHYVRSSVVTNPTTRNRTHAFAAESAARRHADRFHGVQLSGSEAPFAAVGPE